MQVLETQDDVIVVLDDAFAVRREHAPQAAVTPSRSRPRSRWWLGLVVLGSYLSMAVLYFGATWRDPTHRLIGTRGDPTLFMWYLRWVPRALAHGHNPLFSGYVNAPHGVNLMWNTAILLPAVVMAPVTNTWGAIFSYNLLATLAMALSAFSLWWALRRVAGLGWGAWVGGAVFAFSPFMVSQSLGHLHMTLAFFVPLIGVAAYEVFVQQRVSARRGGLALGLLAAAQALTGEELLAIAAVGLAVALVVLSLLNLPEVPSRVRHAVRASIWALVSFVVIAGGPLVYQVVGPQAVTGSVQPRDLYVTDLYSPVLPTMLNWFHNRWSWGYTQRFPAKGGEWSSYLGIPLILLLVFVVVMFRRHRGVLAAGLVALVMFVFSLGPHLHAGAHNWGVPLPWDLVGSVPPLDNLLPVRLMFVVDLIAAGLIGFAIQRAWRARPRLRPFALVAVVAAVVAAAPTTKFPSAGVLDPPFFASAAANVIPAGSLAVVAPFPTPDNVSTLRWQLDSGFRYRIAGGYAIVPGTGDRASFYGPDSATSEVLLAIQHGASVSSLDVFRLIAMASEIRSSGAQTVIVGPMLNEQNAMLLFEEILGGPPNLVTGGVAVWTGVPQRLS